MVTDQTRSRWWRSVRVRVAASATVLVAVVLVVVSVVLVRSQRATLTDQLDDTLAAEAERLGESLDVTESPRLGDDDLLAAVFDADGRVVTELGDEGEVTNFAELLRIVIDRGDDHGDVTIDGDRYRVAVEQIDDRRDGARVVVAGPADDIDESVSDLIRSLLVIVPLALFALVVVVWLVVGRTLRPVERIRARVASIDVAALDERVPVPEGGDELTRLAETMNAMLARLDTSVRRQQRFVADASHELRTPLTRMRTELEVDDRDPAGADPTATRRSQLQEIDGLQRMIEDLLLLARSDAHTVVRGTEPVDLDDLVLEEVAARSGSAVAIDTSGVSAAQVTGSRHELQRVLRNLVDNACRHASSRVELRLAELDGNASLDVDDDGPGIALGDRQRVLERFARLDESRTGAEPHAGLGLAIVDDIVRRHGGTVAIGDSELGGARVSVRLPLADVSRTARDG